MPVMTRPWFRLGPHPAEMLLCGGREVATNPAHHGVMRARHFRTALRRRSLLSPTRLARTYAYHLACDRVLGVKP